MDRIVLIGLLITGIVFADGVSASTRASGTFSATQSCEAYVSKNKRTNPDGIRLRINQIYSIVEVNKASRPDWFRVRIDDANPAERWVAGSCGQVDVRLEGAAEAGQAGSASSCHLPGSEDSYVLALSWQPAFCESHQDKVECRIDDPKSYQAHHFTLHGLWPNQAGCGIHYEFCGEVRGKRADFCDYPALPLAPDVRADLEQVMPSASSGTCLQRHEWFKHGTCQNDWALDPYFSTAVELTRQFNDSGIAYFVSRNLGNQLTEQALIERVDCAHGAGAHRALELNCERGNLVDVYVHLPADFTMQDTIGELMRKASGEFRSNCGGRFSVDPIGISR